MKCLPSSYPHLVSFIHEPKLWQISLNLWHKEIYGKLSSLGKWTFLDFPNQMKYK